MSVLRLLAVSDAFSLSSSPCAHHLQLDDWSADDCCSLQRFGVDVLYVEQDELVLDTELASS